MDRDLQLVTCPDRGRSLGFGVKSSNVSVYLRLVFRSMHSPEVPERVCARPAAQRCPSIPHLNSRRRWDPVVDQELIGMIARDGFPQLLHCRVQSAVGWGVTLQCRMRRLPTSIATKSKSTRKPSGLPPENLRRQYLKI
jgi:hypothetical protein